MFTSVTGALGNAANNGCIAAGDLDNDGYVDYVVSNYGNDKMDGPLRILWHG